MLIAFAFMFRRKKCSCGDERERRALASVTGLFSVPVLHAVPGVRATRLRVAQTEEVSAWPRSGHADTSSSVQAGRSPACMMGETGTPESLGMCQVSA